MLGYTRLGNHQIGAGFVVRNYHGKVIVAAKQELYGNGDKTLLEGRVLFLSIQKAKENLLQIQCESYQND